MRAYHAQAETSVLDGKVDTGSAEFQENQKRMTSLVEDLHVKVAKFAEGAVCELLLSIRD